MLQKGLSLVALVVLVGLCAIGMPNYIAAFSDRDVTPAAVAVSGLVVVLILVGAVMLLLFGVLQVQTKPKESA